MIALFETSVDAAEAFGFRDETAERPWPILFHKEFGISAVLGGQTAQSEPQLRLHIR